MWCCVKTKLRSEKRANFELLAQGYETFLPMCKNEKAGKIEALFPCYLFIDIKLGEDDIAPIRSTRGVQGGIVKFGDHIPSVDESIIEEMKSKINEDDVINLEKDFFQEGELVIIKEGSPFAFLSGVITAKSSDERVWVLINELGSHPIKLKKADIELK